MIDFAYEKIVDHAEAKDNSTPLVLSLTDSMELVEKVKLLEAQATVLRGEIRKLEAETHQLKTDAAVAFQEAHRERNQKLALIKKLEENVPVPDYHFNETRQIYKH